MTDTQPSFTPYQKMQPHRWNVVPINHRQLVALVNTCDPHRLIGLRNRLMFALMWENALTREQVATLTIGQITDGQVQLSAATRAYFDAWMDARKTAKIPRRKNGPVFLRVNGEDKFTRRGDQTALPLGGDAVNEAVKRAVRDAGFDHPDQYSSTSLYLGGRAGD